jgi:sigma-E factor negative regulatory protein RseA
MNPLHETDPDARQGELVSALCDGSLEPRELDALLAHCRTDDEVQARWHGYQVIGEVLRGQAGVLPARAPSEFLQRLHAGLAADATGPTVQPAARPLPQVRGEASNDAVFRWKLASGLASVVAVAAIGWNMLSTSAPAGEGGLRLAGSAPAVVPVAAPSAAAVAAAPAPEARPVVVATPQGRVIRDAALERLLAEHRQHGGMSAFQTSTGFIRNATYDADAR